MNNEPSTTTGHGKRAVADIWKRQAETGKRRLIVFYFSPSNDTRKSASKKEASHV
jgi:hypothetical protein